MVSQADQLKKPPALRFFVILLTDIYHGRSVTKGRRIFLALTHLLDERKHAAFRLDALGSHFGEVMTYHVVPGSRDERAQKEQPTL